MHGRKNYEDDEGKDSAGFRWDAMVLTEALNNLMIRFLQILLPCLHLFKV